MRASSRRVTSPKSAKSYSPRRSPRPADKFPDTMRRAFGGRHRPLPMIARRSAFSLLLLLLLTACDVDSTVGYNEGALVAGSSCQTDALSRCDDGVCAVKNLFPAPLGAVTLAVDDTDIFFLSSAVSIGKHPIEGGDSVELANADSTLMRMASDATHLYWTELNGQVRGVTKAGAARFDASYV